MFLDKQTFATVIKSTPLVSIDLVVINEEGQALLGQRLNRPAQGFWFVPGGRVQKNEPIEIAFQRLTQEELGKAFSIDEAELIGPYTHIYDDNVFGDDFGTHYVAIAYRLKIATNQINLPYNQQHSGYRWQRPESIINDKTIHTHSQWYFQS